MLSAFEIIVRDRLCFGEAVANCNPSSLVTSCPFAEDRISRVLRRMAVTSLRGSYFNNCALRPRFEGTSRSAGGILSGDADSTLSRASAAALFVRGSLRRTGLRKRGFTMPGSVFGKGGQGATLR